MISFRRRRKTVALFIYSLGSVFHLLLFLLRSSGPSHSVVAASRKTAERGTLDRKKIFTPPICHPPCSTHLTGTREGMWGSGVKKKRDGGSGNECVSGMSV